MAAASPKALQKSLSQLRISSDSQATPKIMQKSEPADSWEDEADASDSDTEAARTPVLLPNSPPGPPPPTPASPSQASYPLSKSPYTTFAPPSLDGAFDSSRNLDSDSGSRRARIADDAERRPDKSTAVASRLIAAGIGQKAPRRTKEEREYDQALKLQEKKKRDQAREDEERKRRETEQAKRDVWGD